MSDRSDRATYFDGWYDGQRATRTHDIFTRELGLPPEVEPNSFVTPAALDRIAAELAVAPGQRLVDLACGRGGPGLWLARVTGARLLGIDFSAVALAHARERAEAQLPDGAAEFRLGDLAATGLDDGVADAVVCIDAFQLAADYDAAAAEALRVLRAGGRYVQTSWEPSNPDHPELPERMRALAFRDILTRAGFDVLTVEERPDLQEREQRVFRAALEAGEAGDDEALRSLQEEARKVLGWPEFMRRVLVVAERPTTARASVRT